MIVRPIDLTEEFTNVHKGILEENVLSTGFVDMDEYIRLAKNYLAIFTGYPSSGKSEFVDAVLVNMACMHGWKGVFFSPENFPIQNHMRKLSEKYIGKKITSFNKIEMESAMEWLDKHFRWLDPEKPELSIILEYTLQRIKEESIDFLVIDPWNSMMHNRTQMVHEYLSEALSTLIRFARKHNILICVVAHPKAPVQDAKGHIAVPDLYSISDGAMWRNKADYGVICHRPDMSKNEIEIYIQKIKQKYMGKIGMVKLDYDWKSGRFKGKFDNEYLLPTEIPLAF